MQTFHAIFLALFITAISLVQQGHGGHDHDLDGEHKKFDHAIDFMRRKSAEWHAYRHRHDQETHTSVPTTVPAPRLVAPAPRPVAPAPRLPSTPVAKLPVSHYTYSTSHATSSASQPKVSAQHPPTVYRPSPRFVEPPVLPATNSAPTATFSASQSNYSGSSPIDSAYGCPRVAPLPASSNTIIPISSNQYSSSIPIANTTCNTSHCPPILEGIFFSNVLKKFVIHNCCTNKDEPINLNLYMGYGIMEYDACHQDYKWKKCSKRFIKKCPAC